MANEETKGLRKKSGRQRARRRKELEHDEESKVRSSGLRRTWLNGGKQSLLTLAFAVAVIFICFVGQDPPGLRTLGEYAPENVYSDRSFHYLSEIRRKEAEEWIRSSTPREFARNFAGEERFSKAVIRLEDGLLANNARCHLHCPVFQHFF